MEKIALKLSILLCIAALISGCKLAIIVVEGGEVQSEASDTCVTGSICIINVDDPYFSETYYAVPDEGWYFHRWNSGQGFFCGGFTEPTCPLSFEGHEESEAVEEIVASSEMFYLMPIFKAYQDIIKVDGKEWLQPALFTNLSWNDINAACPEGLCAGVLNGIDMNGWTWASVDDVNALFNYYIGSDELGPEPDRYSAEESPWAPAFYEDGWRPIEIDDRNAGLADGAAGWVRDKSEGGLAYWAELVDVLLPVPPGPPDLAITDNLRDVLTISMDVGGWFYRIP